MAATTEKAVVNNLEEVLDEIKHTSDPEELATLVILGAELYSQGNGFCETKKNNGFHNCQRSMETERDKMFNALTTAFKKLKGV